MLRAVMLLHTLLDNVDVDILQGMCVNPPGSVVSKPNLTSRLHLWPPVPPRVPVPSQGTAEVLSIITVIFISVTLQSSLQLESSLRVALVPAEEFPAGGWRVRQLPAQPVPGVPAGAGRGQGQEAGRGGV